MDLQQQYLYEYKGTLYEESPVKNYIVKSEYVLEEEVIVKVIKRKGGLHWTLVPFLALVAVIVVFNVTIYNTKANNTFYHTTRVPEEMYYDERTGTIDVDLENDAKNLGDINIKLIEDSTGELVFELTGIKPGESVGSIPVEGLPFDGLPKMCTLQYNVNISYLDLDPIEKKVMLVDRAISDQEINEYF